MACINGQPLRCCTQGPSVSLAWAAALAGAALWACWSARLRYSHPIVKRTPLPQARVPVFLWIPRDSLNNSEELLEISGAIVWISKSVFLPTVSLDSKIAVISSLSLHILSWGRRSSSS